MRFARCGKLSALKNLCPRAGTSWATGMSLYRDNRGARSHLRRWHGLRTDQADRVAALAHGSVALVCEFAGDKPTPMVMSYNRHMLFRTYALFVCISMLACAESRSPAEPTSSSPTVEPATPVASPAGAEKRPIDAGRVDSMVIVDAAVPDAQPVQPVGKKVGRRCKHDDECRPKLKCCGGGRMGAPRTCKRTSRVLGQTNRRGRDTYVNICPRIP